MKVLILLGLPLSGKSTHAIKINEILDFEVPLVETGPFVFKAVEEAGLESTPNNVKQVVAKLKEEEGDAVFTVRALNYVRDNYHDAPVVFFSGVKARSEMEVLIDALGKENVYLVSFHASFGTRHSRLTNTDRQASSGGSKSVEDQAMAADPAKLQLRDTKELSYGLGELMALADFVINTEDILWPHKKFDDTLSDFQTVINDILK
ncbi:MAG: hypothetical protein ACXAE3_01090 [Candidatus Kariarchaeaceae archaeon]|jgi:dephospho-CoA kinase